MALKLKDLGLEGDEGKGGVKFEVRTPNTSRGTPLILKGVSYVEVVKLNPRRERDAVWVRGFLMPSIS